MSDETADPAVLPLGSSAYYLVRFSPRPLRPDLAVLFAWLNEMDRLRRLSNSGIALTRISWWRDESVRAAAGRATHPLASALGGLISRDRLHKTDMDSMLSAMERHFQRSFYADAAEVADHHREVSGTFALMAARLMGIDTDSQRTIMDCGAYYGLLQTVRRLGAERHACVPLIPDETRTLTNDDAEESIASAVIADLCDQAARLRPSTAAAQSLPPTLRGMLSIADALLKEIRRSGTTVWDAELDLTPLRTLWVVWRHGA